MSIKAIGQGGLESLIKNSTVNMQKQAPQAESYPKINGGGEDDLVDVGLDEEDNDIESTPEEDSGDGVQQQNGLNDIPNEQEEARENSPYGEPVPDNSTTLEPQRYDEPTPEDEPVPDNSTTLEPQRYDEPTPEDEPTNEGATKYDDPIDPPELPESDESNPFGRGIYSSPENVIGNMRDKYGLD